MFYCICPLAISLSIASCTTLHRAKKMGPTLIPIDEMILWLTACSIKPDKHNKGISNLSDDRVHCAWLQVYRQINYITWSVNHCAAALNQLILWRGKITTKRQRLAFISPRETFRLLNCARKSTMPVSTSKEHLNFLCLFVCSHACVNVRCNCSPDTSVRHPDPHSWMPACRSQCHGEMGVKWCFMRNLSSFPCDIRDSDTSPCLHLLLQLRSSGLRSIRLQPQRHQVLNPSH